MKPDEQNIDEILRRAMPSAPRDEMEPALDRVYARLKIERARTVADPVVVAASPRAGRWRAPVMTIAAAAAVIALAVWIGATARDQGVAVLEAADASVYRISDGTRVPIHAGERIAAHETLQSNGGGGAILALVDGSRIEMRSQSELLLDRADAGLAIHLNTGSIIVTGAKDSSARLSVRTKDMSIAVGGAVSMVSVANDGSRVGVIEGQARVREEKIETTLRPTEQVSTSPTLAANSLKESIAWSRRADTYRTILETFEKGMAVSAGPLTAARGTFSPLRATPQQPDAAASSSQFEEASIRPCDPDNIPEPPAGARGGGANSLQMTPGRLHGLCLTVATLIRTAYGYAPADFFRDGGRAPAFNYTNVYGLGVEDGRRVRGGPDWVRNERYTIDAVASDASNAETMSRRMLRALLEKRFHLQAHIESEQIPAFDLVVAPGGLKIKEGTCTPRDASEPLRTGGSTTDVARKNIEAARRGATTAAPCGMVFAANGPNALVLGAGAGLPALSGLFGVPVNDRTAIPATTRFNYVLEFSRDETMTGPLARVLAGGPGTPNVQVASDPSAVPPAPNFFIALEQQLGLRLEPARAPREFIVIDRVERPSAD